MTYSMIDFLSVAPNLNKERNGKRSAHSFFDDVRGVALNHRYIGGYGRGGDQVARPVHGLDAGVVGEH